MAARTGLISDITAMTGGERVQGTNSTADAHAGDDARVRDRPVGEAVSSRLTSRMRVLAHVHTFNDADIIDRTIAAVIKRIPSRDEVMASRIAITTRLQKVQGQLRRLV